LCAWTVSALPEAHFCFSVFLFLSTQLVLLKPPLQQAQLFQGQAAEEASILCVLVGVSGFCFGEVSMKKPFFPAGAPFYLWLVKVTLTSCLLSEVPPCYEALLMRECGLAMSPSYVLPLTEQVNGPSEALGRGRLSQPSSLLQMFFFCSFFFPGYVPPSVWSDQFVLGLQALV